MQWLVSLLPRKIAEAPERVLINCMCVLIGVAALAAEGPRSLLALWPDGFAYTWALGIAAGGACALVGYWHQATRWGGSLERLGYLLVLLAALVYGIGVLVVFGWQGLPSGAIFLGIAFSKAVRLLVTSAYRNSVLRNGATGGGH